MCSEKQGNRLAETVQNLRQPLPLPRKLYLVVRNNWRKMRTFSDCCGNYGEPGC